MHPPLTTNNDVQVLQRAELYPVELNEVKSSGWKRLTSQLSSHIGRSAPIVTVTRVTNGVTDGGDLRGRRRAY